MYSLKSAMVLTLLYLPYMLMLRRESFFRFNRLMLLAIMVLSLLLPLCNIPGMSLDRQPVMHAAQVQMIELGIPVHMLPELQVTADTPSQTAISIFMLVSLLYIIGMVMVLVTRLWQVGRLWYGLKRGSLWQQQEDGITVCCHAEQVMPFSWMNSIVISEQDYREAGREIVLHETGHIRSGHSWDVLVLTLVQMVQWWNPLVYVLGISLRDVHEYEADDYVLRQGVSAQEYQLLLIKKAVGSGSYAFANNFNHSLTKKRITMMKKSKSNPWMLSKALYVIPVAALALSAFATPKFIAPIESAVSKLEGMSTENVDEKLVSFKPGDPSRIGFTILKGTWVEQEVDGKNSSFIEEKTTTTPYLPINSFTIKLDGKVVDVNDLCDMPASALKKFEKKFPEREVNLVTTSETTDKKMINVTEGTLKVVVDGKEMTEQEAVKAVEGKEIKNSVSTQTDGTTVLETTTAEPDDEPVVDKPEVLPEYPGGQNEFWTYMRQTVKYPKEAQEWGVEGRIYVEFVVEKDGSITNIKVIKGAGDLKEVVVMARKAKDDSPEEVRKENEDKARIALQEEAMRVVKAMPKWTPGRHNGKPVRTKFVLPVSFRLR